MREKVHNIQHNNNNRLLSTKLWIYCSYCDCTVPVFKCRSRLDSLQNFADCRGTKFKTIPTFWKKNHKNIFIISFLFWPYCPRIELIDGPARADKEQHCWFSQLVSSQITALGFLFLLEMSTGRGGVQWTGLYRYPEYRKYLEELSQIPFLHHHSSIYC